MGQGEFGIVKGPVSGESHQAALMGHLEQTCELHKRLPLDDDNMLSWYALGELAALREG